jgi:hemin uptake protein HemP
MESTLHPADSRRTPIAASPTASTQVDSRDLLRGAREIVIRHGDQEYRLRHTQNDKLILTK